MEPVQQRTKPPSLVLWKSPDAAPIAARIAITGDYLPPSNLGISSDAIVWQDTALPLAPLFQDVHATFVNLECPVAAVGLHSSAPAVEHRTAPTASLQYLSAIHSKTVGLANNHSYDFGPPGLERTRAAILEHGMIPLGARGKARSHPEVRVWRGSAGIRVGFWAAARVAGDSPVSKSSYVEPADFDRALHALECMRRHEAQFCVALLHAGARGPSAPTQRTFA